MSLKLNLKNIKLFFLVLTNVTIIGLRAQNNDA